jgi:SAM-dependent methyltransferase
MFGTAATALKRAVERPGEMVGCPVCGADSDAVADTGEPLAQRLNRALGATGAAQWLTGQECLRRCRACTLEFADPMVAPAEGFYLWLTQSGFPYPAHRWEWDASLKRLARRPPDAGLLDIGCGDGQFLAFLERHGRLRGEGIDLNPDVVDAARRAGHAVFGGTVETYLAAKQQLPEVVTLWHVVEHVSDPLGLLRGIADGLPEGGEILFSVPLSPMSFEARWPDPFNAPPHHLTRWNERSLHALAHALGLKVELTLPAAASARSRALRALVLDANDGLAPHRSRCRKAAMLAARLLREPTLWRKELARQRGWPTLNGLPRPDVVLVALTRVATV